jgi:hypothetical protein
MRGYLFDAYAYGYFRTLLIKVEAPEVNKDVLTVGGRNAIIEDVALDSAEFELHFDIAGYREALPAPRGHEWITESYVLSLELGRADTFGEVLERLALDRGLPEAAAPRNWALQRVLTTRLKRLRVLLPSRHFATAASSVLRGAPSAEPDLFMFLCEAVWFWLDQGPLPSETVEHVERLLTLGLNHSDPNIRLAAIISTAKYCSQLSYQIEAVGPNHLMVRLVSSLGRLVSSSYLSATTYFEQVYRTCLYALPTIGDARQRSLLEAVELLKSIPQGEAGLGGWLGRVEDSSNVALMLLVLLWRAPWLQDVEMISKSFGRLRRIHALRAQFFYKEKATAIYVLCSVTPEEDLFMEWLKQASATGLLPENPKVLRVAARATTLEAAYDENIICGGDLVDLIVSDARLERALESFVD